MLANDTVHIMCRASLCVAVRTNNIKHDLAKMKNECKILSIKFSPHVWLMRYFCILKINIFVTSQYKLHKCNCNDKDNCCTALEGCKQLMLVPCMVKLLEGKSLMVFV